MDYIRNLIFRYWVTGSLLVIGLILIVYIALGVVYFQQGPKQAETNEQIAQLSAILSRPLLDISELQAEFDEVTQLMIPQEPPDAIRILVEIADKNGIDVSEEGGNLLIPSAGTPSSATIGGNTYRILGFTNIRVQGEPANVMAFITDLDTGRTQNTLVLTKVVLSESLFVNFTGPEADRRAEFRQVKSAVETMMTDNDLTFIPFPIDFSSSMATNFMGDDPDTPELEGFPDNTSVQEWYTGNDSPRAGYVLYRHDKINFVDTSQFTTSNYIQALTTEYFYTCESDGTVRQWDVPIIALANEFTESEVARNEIRVVLDVEFYSSVPKQ